MAKELFLILIIFLLKYISCYIVFNIELLPKENYVTLYELNSPKDIISREIISSFYTEIEIGSPFQKIPLLIRPKIVDFIITSIHKLENPSHDYTSQNYVYNFSPKFLENKYYFNENKSASYNYNFCEKRSPIDENEKPLAEYTCYSNDSFLVYTNINLNKKEIIENLNFELVKNSKDNITGTIGLNLKNMFNQVSLLSLLKKYNLIDNYYWFFEFEKWNANKGKLIIGALPHDIELYQNKFSKDDLVFTPGAGSDYVYYQVVFDEIYFKNSTGDKIILGKEVKTEINLESNVIIGTRSFKEYLNYSLYDLIEENKCFFESIKNYNDELDFYLDYYFFYCQNTEDTKKKLSDILPDIFFYSKNLNYNFELKKEQILVENGEFIYIYIIFCHQYNNWYLGKQISLKYQFVFNPEVKNVYFYRNKNNKKDDNNEKNYLPLKIGGIVALCIIFGVLGVVLGKKIYGMRKKRANELKEDNYEYFPENNIDNHNTNSEEKLFNS